MLVGNGLRSSGGVIRTRLLFIDRMYISLSYSEARVKASSWGAKPVPLRFLGYVDASDVSSVIRS